MSVSPELTTLRRLQAWSRHDDRSIELSELGLILHEDLAPLGYWASPTNAVAFASTGGDGVTFSLLDRGDGVVEASPVVMTVPMAFGSDLQPNWVVGQDLREFLALGLDTGYFVLEQLAYDADFPEEISRARGRSRHPLLDELAAEFTLLSWADVRGRLDQLTRSYSPLLRLPTSSDGQASSGSPV